MKFVRYSLATLLLAVLLAPSASVLAQNNPSAVVWKYLLSGGKTKTFSTCQAADDAVISDYPAEHPGSLTCNFPGSACNVVSSPGQVYRGYFGMGGDCS